MTNTSKFKYWRNGLITLLFCFSWFYELTYLGMNLIEWTEK